MKRECGCQGWQLLAVQQPKIAYARKPRFSLLYSPELGGAARHHLTTSGGMKTAYDCADGCRAPKSKRPSPMASCAERSSIPASLSKAVGPERQAVPVQFEPYPSPYGRMRWWIEGDQLGTSLRGCCGFLADVRVPHVVRGGPPRICATFMPDWPDD